MAAELNFPPSLPEELRARSFEAINGELGVLPRDTRAFLEACASDGAQVLGWELWLADHRDGLVGPEPSRRSWAGLIPTAGEKLLSVFADEGDAAEARNQLAVLGWARINPQWLRHVRVNFTFILR